jgi:RNA-directed DNA polymerase
MCRVVDSRISLKRYGGESRDEHLGDLDERLRSGRSQAPPVERVWLDKDYGKQRPIGKPTCEDKIVQRAVVMLWEVIDA